MMKRLCLPDQSYKKIHYAAYEGTKVRQKEEPAALSLAAIDEERNSDEKLDQT